MLKEGGVGAVSLGPSAGDLTGRRQQVTPGVFTSATPERLTLLTTHENWCWAEVCMHPLFVRIYGDPL